MDKWSNAIRQLSEDGCKWNSGIPDHVRKIKDLVQGIGADPNLEAHEIDWLIDVIKQDLSVPKGTLRHLVKEMTEQAFPPEPLPRGYVEATGQPIDLQIAHLVLEDQGNLLGECSWSLFRYSKTDGYWGHWPDTPAKKAALVAAQRLAVRGGDGWENPYGTASHVKAALDQLKVLTSDGPLSNDQPPAVIAFRNGTFNLKTNQLEEHSPENGATYGVAADYIPNAECPAELERVIKTCYPEGSMEIIRALIRWCIDPTIRYGEAFHIIGPSGSGKGLIIDFCRSLFPASVVGQLLHPSDLSRPEKIHQYVVGRRLIAFPDTPAMLNKSERDAINLFYELVENKPVTTRKLFAGEGEVARLMNCRFILGSVRALQFKDGRDGFLRRVIPLFTLPRSGDPDISLRDCLNPIGERFMQIRAEAISWGLAMPLSRVNAVLDRNDSDGILRSFADDAAKNSDTVSQWADDCLTSTDGSPDLVVSSDDWHNMYESYKGWCEYQGIDLRFRSKRNNFVGQVRQILGPKRCLDRKKASLDEAILLGVASREQLPRCDVGFMLRPGILAQDRHDHQLRLNYQHFRSEKIREGGLAQIAQLPQGTRRLVAGGLRGGGGDSANGAQSSYALDACAGLASEGLTQLTQGVRGNADRQEKIPLTTQQCSLDIS